MKNKYASRVCELICLSDVAMRCKKLIFVSSGVRIVFILL